MPNRKSPFPKWSLYPNLHSEVLQLLLADGLIYAYEESDDDTTAIRSYDTNIMGRFVCHNKACASPGWSSKIIPITIRLYDNQQYNARVYHQRCAKCQLLSKPVLNTSYAERVAYRIKKWAGADVEAPPLARTENRQPHRSNLCEGCKAGHCKQLDD